MPDIALSMVRDTAWFSSLHARAADDVVRYALRRAPNQADAEDAVAETFLVAWRRRDAVPEPPDDVLWLYGVARRALANQARSARRRDRLRLRLRTEQRPSTTHETTDARIALVREALGQLPEAEAELLRLLAWEGLSHRQAAQLLDTTENAIALRASRARRRLSELMTGLQVERT